MGALVGGVLTVVGILLAGASSYWLVLVGGAIGGVAGYLFEQRRRLR